MRGPAVYLLTVAALLLVFAGGCSTGTDSTGSTSGSSSEPAQVADDSSGDGGVEVPDVVGSDGADAVSQLEDAGFTVTLADGTGEDSEFDSSRDASGCETTDQSPSGGDTASDGDDVEIQLDCRQTDWENQEGTAWDAYNEAYSSSFDDGCTELFSVSPDGSLYEDDTEYTEGDCQALNPGDGSDDADLPSDVPDDAEASGTELGEVAGCRALFDEQGLSSLNYGTDSYTADDCPVGGGGGGGGSAAAPRVSAPAGRKKADYYRVSQRVWAGYDAQTKLKAARYFLANNPSDCGQSGIQPQNLVRVIDAGGLGEKSDRPVNDLMLDVCKSPGE